MQECDEFAKLQNRAHLSLVAVETERIKSTSNAQQRERGKCVLDIAV